MATSDEEIINSSTTMDTVSNSEIFCSPCQSDGKRLSAVGYCETCKTALCERCFNYHTLPMPTRTHILTKREQTAVKNEVNKDTIQCPKHEGESLLYHCPTHSFLGCHICFYQHQKTCREVKYIPELSETLTSSDEFKEFMTKLNNATKSSTDLVDECKRNINLVEKCHVNAIAAIKAFKLELLEAIDQLERDLYTKAETFTQEGICKLNSVVDKCLQYETEIQAIATEIETLQNKSRNNDLYISMIKSKNTLLSLETELNAFAGENVVKSFNFEANAKLREALKTSGLGKLTMTEVVKAEHAKDMNVKLANEKIRCQISGSAVLSDQKLIIADSKNQNVKVIDIKQQEVLSSLKLSSWPWCIAKVTNITVAATLPIQNKIVFVRTDPALSIDSEIVMNGECRGVAYRDGKLVVSFGGPYKVEIMDVKGSVLRRIHTDGNGNALFFSPHYVAINPACSLIYVSNYSSHNVVCLRFDGTVAATYKDNELQYPRQAIVDSTGNVFVCGYGSQNIHQMTIDCKKIRVLLTSNDGLSEPFTLSYKETEGNIYVGQNNDNVKVYQVTKECL